MTSTNQKDLMGSTTAGVVVHVPSGVSNSSSNNASDFPNAKSSGAVNSQGKNVAVTVAGNVRFANPC